MTQQSDKLDRSPTSLEVLEQAYLLLLKMPHDGVRAKNQKTLCVLRDAIAAESGLSEQQVQDSFEELALKERLAFRPELQPMPEDGPFAGLLLAISALTREEDGGWSPAASSHLRRIQTFARLELAERVAIRSGCGKPDPNRQDIGFDRWIERQTVAVNIMRPGADREFYWDDKDMREAWIKGAESARSAKPECTYPACGCGTPCADLLASRSARPEFYCAAGGCAEQCINCADEQPASIPQVRSTSGKPLDLDRPMPDPMYFYETPGGSKVSLWPSGTLKIEVNGSAHVRTCMEWHALSLAAARSATQERK